MQFLTDQVDALFAPWDNPQSPGCVLAVIHNGEIVYQRGYGMASLELGVPHTPASVFYIASTSKQFAAASIALLVEAGRLGMDDDIRQYIPELPDYGAPICVHHLVHHTSGLRDYLELGMMAGRTLEQIFSEEDVIEVAARQRELNFKPGDQYLYSNTGYVLMAVLVRRVTGQSLRQFADEQIFKPLGMANTVFKDQYNMVIKNRVASYMPAPDGGYVNAYSNLEAVGDGGLFTTVGDLYLWDQNFYTNKLGKGGSGLIDLMLTTRPLNDGTPRDYAFGLRLSAYRGLKTVSHGGGLPGFRTQMMRFPEQKFTVIVLANLGIFDPDALCCRAADLYLADQFTEPLLDTIGKPAAFIDLPEAQLRDKAGVYHNLENGALWELAVVGGKLTASLGSFDFQLAPLSDTHFRTVGAPLDITVSFEKSDDGRWKMAVQTADSQTTYLDPAALVPPTAQQLNSYAGSFFSDELQTTYKLFMQDGQLFIKHRMLAGKPLKPYIADALRAGDLRLHFSRENGRIAGFTLHGGRVRNLRFERK